MFHKQCNTCRNKTCLKTKSICKSLDIYLTRFETKRQEDLMRPGPKLEFFNYLTQGIDNKEVMKEVP